MAVLPRPPAGSGFVRRLLDFVDCQAQAIGAGGYQALAAPGSTLVAAADRPAHPVRRLVRLSAAVRPGPSVRDGVLALVKIGIVLALATSWTAYRTLVYDVALKGRPSSPPRSAGRPACPAPAAAWSAGSTSPTGPSTALAVLARAGTAAAPAADREQRPAPTPQTLAGFNELALGGAADRLPDRRDRRARRGAAGRRPAARARAVLHRLPAVRGHARPVRRLAAGARRRGAWRARRGDRARRRAGPARALAGRSDRPPRAPAMPIPGAPVELFVVALVFALALAGDAGRRGAGGLRLPAAARLARCAGARPRHAARRTALRRAARAQDAAGRGPVARRDVADAVAATQRREAGPGGAAADAAAGGAAVTRAAARPSVARDLPPAAPAPLGQSFRRRTRGRVSARAGRRDQRR